MSQILIVGGGKGSWEIRGHQLGTAIGASVKAKPKTRQFNGSDVVVLVKHAALSLADQVKTLRARIVWDVLDVWRQPDENPLQMAAHIEQIRRVRDGLGVSVTIAATQAMAEDIGGLYLPHHSRPGLVPTPIRKEARIVAYEGAPKYLGPWREAIEIACARLGLEFVINPTNLSDADVVVAFRGGVWDSEVCRRWKSGVKCVNAIAAGRPVITQRCAAFDEIQPPGLAIEDPSQVARALVDLMPISVRQPALERCHALAPQFRLETIAAQYLDMLTTMSARRAA